MEKDEKAKLEPFVGASLQRVEKLDYSWFFTFGESLLIATGSLWRLITPEKIAVSSEDHGHKFGLPQPVDASESVLPRLASLKVQTISIDGQTGDFVRRNGIRLQQIHTHGFAIKARHRTDRLDAEPLPLQLCKVVHFPRPQQVSAPPPFQSRCRL